MAEVKEKEFKTGQKVKYSTKDVDYSLRVRLRATDKALFHEPGEEFEGSEILARNLESQGKAKRI